MNKYLIIGISLVVLVGMLGLQTHRLGAAQEKIGGLELQTATQQAIIDAKVESDILISQVKAAIRASRAETAKTLQQRNLQIREALADVKANTCFYDSTAVPVEYVRVLNSRDPGTGPESD